MIGWLNRLLNVVMVFVLIALVFLALLTSVGRELVPLLSNFRAEIEQELSLLIGQPVRIREVEASWSGLDPELVLRDVRVGAADVPALLTSAELRLRLDGLASIRSQWPKLGLLRATGMELRMAFAPDSGVSFPGWTASASEPPSSSKPEAGALLTILNDTLVELPDSLILVSLPDERVAQVQADDLNFQYRAGELTASTSVRLDGQALADVALQGTVDGQLRFSGVTYLRATDKLLNHPYFDLVPSEAVKILSARGEAQLWAHWQTNGLERVSSQLSLASLAVRTKGSPAPVELSDLALQAQAQKTVADQWVIGVHQLGVSWNDQRWVTDALISEGDGWTVQIDKISLPFVRDVLLALDSEAEPAFGDLRDYWPGGSLHRINVEIPAADDTPLRIQAELVGVSVRAAGGAPAATGLDGYLEMVGSEGFVEVDSAAATLAFPDLFLEGWDLAPFMTTVRWKYDDQWIRVWSEGITMHFGSKTQLLGNFDLYLDNADDPEHKETLALRIDITDAKVAEAYRFVPYHAVGAGLHDYLKGALKEGRVVSGFYEGQGQIGATSPEGSFVSTMRFDLEDATIAFLEDWQALEKVSARIDVKNADATITMPHAVIGKMPVNDATVRVLDRGGENWVTVKASAVASEGDIHYLLSESPIRDAVVDVAGLVRATGGSVTADLSIESPLEGEVTSRQKVDVDMRLDDVRLDVSGVRLPLEGMTGDLRYSLRDGLFSKSLKGRFGGSPVLFKAYTELARQKKAVQIVVDGRLDAAAIARLANLPNLPAAKGTTPFMATVRVPFEDPNDHPSLTLSMPLGDMALDWPAFLKKQSGAPAPLMIRADFEPTITRVMADWGIRGRGRATFGPKGVNDVVMLFGQGAMPDLKPGEFHVWLRSPSVTVSDWQRFYADHLEPLTRGSSPSTMPLVLNLETETLDTDLYRFKDIKVSYQKDGATRAWWAKVDGKNIQGEAAQAHDSDSIQVNFKRLHLDTLRMAEDEPSPDGSAKDADEVKASRSIIFAVDNFSVDDRVLGQWHGKLLMLDNLMRFHDLKIDKDKVSANVQFDWFQGLGENVHVLVDMTVADARELGPMLGREFPITSESGELKLDWRWDGSPQDFALAKVVGRTEIHFAKGSVLENRSSTQVFKVFSLMNSDTLLRRLKLDFDDLSKAGIYFDTMQAVLESKDGVATFQPELLLNGASGSFRIQGSTNLQKESLDMRMVVVLPVTQNLPLAALALGQPIIAGGLYVIDKTLGSSLSRITSATYNLSGTWDVPVLTLRNVFDTEGRGIPVEPVVDKPEPEKTKPISSPLPKSPSANP